MKKLSKLAALAASLVAAVFMGCSNISNSDATISTANKVQLWNAINAAKAAAAADAKAAANEREVTLFATADEGLIIFGDDESRTILPGALASSDLDFHLLYVDKIGVSTTTRVFTPVVFNSVDSKDPAGYTTGTITKAFAISDYEFTLYAVAKGTTVTESTVITKAIYVAYANADLRYDDKISFHLMANTNSGAKGTLSVKISNLAEWLVPDGYEVNVALYDTATDAAVYPSTPKGVTLTDVTGGRSVVNFTFKGSSDESAGEIAPGEYNLVVKYIKKDGEKVDATYEYSEKVIILGNQNSEAAISIPDILERVPVAPTNFIVAYQNPVNKDSDFFTANFAWFDNANNEREYVIDLIEYTSTDNYYLTPDGTTVEWPTSGSEAKPYLGKELDKMLFQNSEWRVAGSLNKNSMFATISLRLGHRYMARICASNEAGKSEWAYLKFAITAAETKSGAGDAVDMNSATSNAWGKTTLPWLPFDTDVTTINRYRVTYDLNGGVFQTTAGAAPDKAPVLVFYASQHNEDYDTASASTDLVPIINPDGVTACKWYTNINGCAANLLETAATITLVNGRSVWDRWCVGEDDPTNSPYTTQNYEYDDAPEAYVKNIKYYPDGITKENEAATALPSQPNDDGTNYNKGKYTKTPFELGKGTDPLKVKRWTIAPWTKCENLYLVAHYDTTQTINVEVEDITLYELHPDYFTTTFVLSPAETKINYAGTVTAAEITDMGKINAAPYDNVLEVSQQRVKSIKWTVNDEKAKFKVTTFDEDSNTFTAAEGTYDRAHLRITDPRLIMAGENVAAGTNIKYDKDYASSSDKSWTINITTWKPGKYNIQFTATTSEMPGKTFSYTAVLYITQ